ncbi:anthranilate synthase component I [bacterium]|nr:anthranilate synthase component I [bacterium]
MILTTFEEFEKTAFTLPLVPVAAEILGDFETPVSTYLRLTSGKYRFLLESVDGASQRGRFSIIGDSPLVIFKCKNHQVRIENRIENSTIKMAGNPLDILKSLMKKYSGPKINGIPFHNNGFFGVLGYDSVRYIENLPDISADDLDLPDVHLFIPQRIIVFDNLLNKISLYYFIPAGGMARTNYQQAIDNLEQMTEQIHSQAPMPQFSQAQLPAAEVSSNLTQRQFENMVRTAKTHITRGDAFQIVLSQRLKIATAAEPFQIYRALRVINPSPYMFFMKLDDTDIIGSSPETLVRLEDKKISLKPIAGTRRRGKSPEEDAALSAELLADPKECAEHTMLVDLGRNDVGRIAKFGSVVVTDLMSIEKYSHVIHIVSQVDGQLASDMDAVDVFKACFPAGTLSGAPKVRAMEIIENLEPNKRGIYGGAIGYLTFGGDMDVCIAIRTIVYKNGNAYAQAGAGIVADSVPSSEYQETLNKVNGLLSAIHYAEGGLK